MSLISGGAGRTYQGDGAPLLSLPPSLSMERSLPLTNDNQGRVSSTVSSSLPSILAHGHYLPMPPQWAPENKSRTEAAAGSDEVRVFGGRAAPAVVLQLLVLLDFVLLILKIFHRVKVEQTVDHLRNDPKRHDGGSDVGRTQSNIVCHAGPIDGPSKELVVGVKPCLPQL